jgi:hypothetical protein
MQEDKKKELVTRVAKTFNLTEDEIFSLYHARVSGLTIRDACAKVGVSTSTYEKRIQKDVSFNVLMSLALKEGSEIILSSLMKKAKEGDVAAAQSLLAVRDKDYTKHSMKEPYRTKYIKTKDLKKKYEILDEALANGGVSPQAYKAFIETIDRRHKMANLEALEQRAQELAEKLEKISESV